MSIEKIVRSAKNFIKKHRKLLVVAASIAVIGHSTGKLSYAVKKYPEAIKMIATNMIGKTLYRDIQVNYTPTYGIKTIAPNDRPNLSYIDERYSAVTKCLGLDADAHKDSFEVLIYGKGRS